MFDKLGDLLSEALEKGELPKSEDKPHDESVEATFSDFNFIAKKNEDNSQQKKRTGSAQKESGEASSSKKDFSVPRSLPENVRNAFTFINIPEAADFDEAKKIYREKLMYYHPDRRNDNPVLQKVAKEKTARLLKEWEIIEKWYANKG